jgi:hypothetical protein
MTVAGLPLSFPPVPIFPLSYPVNQPRREYYLLVTESTPIDDKPDAPNAAILARMHSEPSPVIEDSGWPMPASQIEVKQNSTTAGPRR